MQGYVKNGTQENMILNYIREHGCITNLDALLKLGIMQCPARIWGLKRKGYDIRTRQVVVYNRYEEPIRIVEYYLKEKEA